MPSFLSRFRHHAAREKAPVVNPTQPISNTSVPLHDLCERCSKFFREWRALTWLQEHRGGAQGAPPPSWPILRFCTIAQLVQSAQRCHFCKKLVSHLQNRAEIGLPRPADQTEVYIHLRRAQRLVDFLVPQPGRRSLKNEEDFNKIGIYKIRTYENSNLTAFDGHITAKHVPVRASDNIQKAKEWLQCCLTEHAECRKFQARTVQNLNQRPTRVLEITLNKIRLRDDFKNEPFDYLVLSYMWGENFTQQLRLLGSNLRAFRKEVPRDKLEASDVYKEAMRVTLALGYKYLWIDSLCIIQDSEADWKYEAQRMAIVYGNATCNLAFLFPPHFPAKPSQRSDPRIWSPCILRAATPSTPGVYMHEDTTNEFRKEIDNYGKHRDWLVQRSWPLFHRAWTFQEYLLSPRTLLLGHKNLMWQCSCHFYDELLGPIAAPVPATSPTTVVDPKRGKDRGKSRYFPDSIHEIHAASVISLFHPTVLSFLTDWQNVVNEYRSRNLSYEKDRMVAFAGIARAFSHLGRLTYLAGLWNEILPAALLWYVDKKPSWLVRIENQIANGNPVPDSTWTPEIIPDKSEESAEGKTAPLPPPNTPSWSWFSIPMYKYYQTSFLLADDSLFVRSKALNSPHLVAWHDIFWAKTMGFQFAGHATRHAPDTAAHEFLGTQITLETSVFPVKSNWPADLAAQMQDIASSGSTVPADGRFRWDPELEYYPDDPASRASPPRDAVYALLSEVQVVRTAGAKNIQRRLAGLMLVPGSVKGRWRRVGVWKLRINVKDVVVDAGNIGGVAERWAGKRIVSEKWERVVVTIV
ncbi:heterokaryon incompatibility protein-domain-containing protein [Bipolaris maydis]|nr:heterokaryon incompatibility protein-domain-containing protein [Bipolaris maydis]KAJ6268480.1 heterokaryon incompatibility protein-domain-containing protein [Bipolaris maydis]